MKFGFLFRDLPAVLRPPRAVAPDVRRLALGFDERVPERLEANRRGAKASQR